MVKEIKVIRTDKESLVKEEVSMAYAIEKLTGYWNDIEKQLLQGAELWTPFATYQIKISIEEVGNGEV
jgi:hypothetical protein